MTFTFEKLVGAVRRATQNDPANLAVPALLGNIVSDPAPIISATPQNGEDEVCFFEDDTLSIWWCRFKPGIIVPPHEHLIDVHIASYSGIERNLIYKRDGGKLILEDTVDILPGMVKSLPSDVVHAVTTGSGEPSMAIHVYMGPLMQLKRNLYDWETGQAIEFSLENYEAGKRSAL